MKIAAVLPVAFLTGCAAMVTEYPNPASQTEANVPINRCLHLGECEDRPYPIPGYARGLDPRWASGRM